MKKSGRLNRTQIYGEGLSDRMVRTYHTRCLTALDRAVVGGLIRVNPAAGCKLPGQALKDMSLLTREEMQRFLVQAKEEGYYELFLLELATGLRRGEVLALQWDDLDFNTGAPGLPGQRGVGGVRTQDESCPTHYCAATRSAGSAERIPSAN